MGILHLPHAFHVCASSHVDHNDDHAIFTLVCACWGRHDTHTTLTSTYAPVFRRPRGGRRSTSRSRSRSRSRSGCRRGRRSRIIITIHQQHQRRGRCCAPDPADLDVGAAALRRAILLPSPPRGRTMRRLPSWNGTTWWSAFFSALPHSYLAYLAICLTNWALVV